jgi:hypothetical protein
VTIRALLGIKLVRRNRKHIVALDAHAVKNGTDDGAGLHCPRGAARCQNSGLFRGTFGGHGRILAR